MQKSRYSLPSYLEKPLDRVWIWSIRWQWPSLECLFSLNKKAKKPNIIEGEEKLKTVITDFEEEDLDLHRFKYKLLSRIETLH